MTVLAKTAFVGDVAAASPLRSRLSFVLTATYCVATIAATIIVLSTFLALMLVGARGAQGLFALEAGTLAFGALVLVEFVRWGRALLSVLGTGR